MLKDIIGYDGKYAINTNGEVWTYRNGGRGGFWLTAKAHNTGYLIYRLYHNGVQSNILAHRLVGMNFLPNPLNLKEINHKNRIRTDNRVENLEWCTHQQNMAHYYKNKRPSEGGLKKSY